MLEWVQRGADMVGVVREGLEMIRKGLAHAYHDRYAAVGYQFIGRGDME